MPDTTFSTSMKPLWFHEPLTFQPPICPRSSPRGGICHPAAGVTARNGDILTLPAVPVPPTLSMSSTRGCAPSSSMRCSLRQDR